MVNYTPVIIIAGQSNAVGQDAVSNLPSYLRNITNVYVSNGSSAFLTLQAHEGWNQAGAEFNLGYLFRQYYGKDVYIIKHGVNGTSMVGGPWNATNGQHYTDLISYVNTRLAGLTNPKIVSFYFYQGESDAINLRTQSEYQTALQLLIDTTRANSTLIPYFLNGSLNFQIVKISTDWNVPPNWGSATVNSIRAAQIAVSSGSNIGILESNDLPTISGDTIHKTALGLTELGLRAYNSILTSFPTSVSIVLKGRKIAVGAAPSVSFLDADPFLLTWDSGSRITGNIPYQGKDAYFTDNVHDVQGFDAFRDGATTAFYGNGTKITDNNNFPVKISLRKYKAKVDYIRAFIRGSTSPYNFYYVKKGEFTKNLIGTITATGWTQLNLPQLQDVSWLIIENATSSDYPSEIEIHGSYITPATVTSTSRTPKFKKMLWANAFEWSVITGDGRPQTVAERTALLQQHGGIRHYLDRVHLEPAKGDYYFSPGDNNSGSWDYDLMYQSLYNAGIDVRVCIKNSPQWLQNTWPSNLRSSEQLPVEYDTDRATTTAKAYLPASYLAEGKLFFQFAARYGSTVVATNLLSVHTEAGGVFPNNTKRTGLGWVSKVEVTNEPDSWWHGWSGFSVGGQLAARMSCVYDGHKNTMGAGVGVKNADPNMSVSFPGLAVATIETYLEAIDWCRQYRGYKNGVVDVPWDAVNYHLYSNDGGSVQNGGTTTRGQAPEVSGFDQKMQYFIDFTNEYLQGMPVILGEYGYDISQFSDQRAARPIDVGSETSDKTTRKLVQAQWLLRTALLGWIKGMEEVQMYMLDDVSNDEYTHYSQSGMVDGFVRRPSGNFFYQAKALIGEYIVDTVLSTSPYIVRCKYGSLIAYVCWMPTETNATGTYNIPFAAGTSITLYALSTSSTTPTAQNITTTGTYYTVAVNETPIFIIVN